MLAPVPSFAHRHLRQLLLVATLGFLGCGKPGAVYTEHPELAPYLQSFQKLAVHYGVDLTGKDVNLTFSEDPRRFERPTYTAAAFCEKSLGPSEVLVSRRFWNNHPSSASRELLIFHELGHCILDREHDEALQDDGTTPRSIMFPRVFDPKTYSERRSFYLDEVFRGKGKPEGIPIGRQIWTGIGIPFD